jgi:phosphotriesterase-related protein
VAIGHLDRTIFEMSDLLALAETGVRLEFDLFGQESRRYPAQDIDLPNDGGRIAVITELWQRGHGDQILISHDVSSPLRLSANGGEGYHHIFKRVLPVMAQRGWSEGDLRKLVVENPASFLAVKEGSPQSQAAGQTVGRVG